MGDVINLNRARKRRLSAESAAKAEANRVRFGRSKSAKATDRADLERRLRELDDRKLERDR